MGMDRAQVFTLQRSDVYSEARPLLESEEAQVSPPLPLPSSHGIGATRAWAWFEVAWCVALGLGLVRMGLVGATLMHLLSEEGAVSLPTIGCFLQFVGGAAVLLATPTRTKAVIASCLGLVDAVIGIVMYSLALQFLRGYLTEPSGGYNHYEVRA